MKCFVLFISLLLAACGGPEIMPEADVSAETVDAGVDAGPACEIPNRTCRAIDGGLYCAPPGFACRK